MHGFLLLLLAASPSEGLHDRSVVSQPTVAPRHSPPPSAGHRITVYSGARRRSSELGIFLRLCPAAARRRERHERRYRVGYLIRRNLL